jgi:hypothetical protein
VIGGNLGGFSALVQLGRHSITVSCTYIKGYIRRRQTMARCRGATRTAGQTVLHRVRRRSDFERRTSVACVLHARRAVCEGAILTCVRGAKVSRCALQTQCVRLFRCHAVPCNHNSQQQFAITIRKGAMPCLTNTMCKIV